MMAHQNRIRYGNKVSEIQPSIEDYSNENFIQEITNRVTANLKKESEEPKKLQYV